MRVPKTSWTGVVSMWCASSLLDEMEQQDAAGGLRLIDAGECWRLERRQPAARSFVLKMIPDISEQVDAKARIIGYGYGPKYADIELIFNLALVWAWN